MADRISLTGLRVVGRHGVFEFERRSGQEFVVDVALEVDVRRAAASDDLADTVDYADLARRLVEVVAGEPVNLLETLVTRLADVCLGYPGVRACEVTVHKPQAPITHEFSDVSVTIRREATPDRHPVSASPAAGGLADRKAGDSGQGEAGS